MPPEMTFDDSKELLLCFDDNGEVIPPVVRGVVHQKPYKIWHAIVNIWIVNSLGQILCTRRSSSVSGNPNKWQTYVGGHVRSDSSFAETARRELAEEVGLEAGDGNLRLIEKNRREDFMHVFESYALLDDAAAKKIHFDDGEISEARWFYFNEYQQSKAENPDAWCNNLSNELYEKIRHMLHVTKS